MSDLIEFLLEGVLITLVWPDFTAKSRHPWLRLGLALLLAAAFILLGGLLLVASWGTAHWGLQLLGATLAGGFILAAARACLRFSPRAQ